MVQALYKMTLLISCLHHKPISAKKTAIKKASQFCLHNNEVQIIRDSIYGLIENQRCLRANIFKDVHNGMSQRQIGDNMVHTVTQSIIVLSIITIRHKYSTSPPTNSWLVETV